MFRALLINSENDKPRISKISEDSLRQDGVLVKVEYSTLNYKDCLAILHGKPIIRKYPMVTGIDFCGTVLNDPSSGFKAGSQVLMTGFGMGEKFWGGHSELASVDASFLLNIPSGFTMKNAMQCGTAGLTASMAVLKLRDFGLSPESGKILVTGASGGVGTISILLLNKLGFHIIGATSNKENFEFLENLGVREIIDTSTLSSAKILDQQKWIGAIDSLGSKALAGVCAHTCVGGAVVACGNAQGMDFPTSVAPFILRGINLFGLDSVYQTIANRKRAWELLAECLTNYDLDNISTECQFKDILDLARRLIENKVTGRLVLKMQEN